MINYKHTLFKQYKQAAIPLEFYNRYKNNVSRILKESKSNYFSNKFEQCQSNLKSTWLTINSVLGHKRKKSNNITLLGSGGDEFSDSHRVADAFCDYFSTVATTLDSNIPTTGTDPMYYMPDPLPVSFFATPATPDEVHKFIIGLPNKSGNIHCIPVFIYKLISHHISPIICDIFNSCITLGMFPNLLKLAKIIPLFKSKNSKLIKNYRPISLLHLLSKLIEKMIKSRASKFITDNNILYRNQFDTSDAILQFTDDCVTALDNRLSTTAIFLDFSKTFDTVNKDIMLDKLDRLGFRGIIRDLFDSYLSDRRMDVEVNGCKSETKTLNIGLPQGSVSTPWLFNLYINDMHRSSDKLNFLHFADDTTIYLSGRDLTRLCEEVCMELCKVDDWLKANRLSLNIDKTFYMILTHKNYDETGINIRIR